MGFFRKYSPVTVTNSEITISTAHFVESGKNIRMKLICETFYKAGLLPDFFAFYRQSHPLTEFDDAAKEFSKMHPDKFYVPDEVQS